MNIQQAFLAGLADRMAGLPMIARTPDVPELNDAYACGYDPHGEQVIDLPQAARASIAEFTASLIRQCCPTGVPMNLPHNACEFPESIGV